MVVEVAVGCGGGCHDWWFVVTGCDCGCDFVLFLFFCFVFFFYVVLWLPK